MSRLYAGYAFATLLLSLKCQAWTYEIHNFIFEAALEQIPSGEQQYYRNTVSQWRNITKANAGVTFAAWADTVKEQSIAELLGLQNQQLPRALVALSQNNTSAWHYQNRHKIPGKPDPELHCEAFNRGELFAALKALDIVLRSPQEEKTRVILSAIFVHLLADFHQPMHNITAVENCESDRGGNLFCFSEGCEKNLHGYWDTAAGAALRKAPKPPTVLPLRDLKLESWSKENAVHASFIYSTPKNKEPSLAYQRKAGIISQRQVRRASNRLAGYMRQVYLWQNQAAK